jgi:hypothetical protein
MNLKLVGCIAMGVFVAHLALFMMIFGIRSRSEGSTRLPEAPNLRIAEEVVVDPATKVKTVNREITVSTKLRTELYRERNDSPPRK